jgi:polar amino acid transport system substrate-binding protein
MRRRSWQLIGLMLVAATLAGCGATSDHALRLTLAALGTPTPQPAQSSSSSKAASCTDLTGSLRPPATLPAPGRMPAGSFMKQIQRRGYLIAGVNASLYRFAYLDVNTGKIQGFEIDLVRELATAIFGNPDDYRLVALTVPQRIPYVQQGTVDIVVDAVTITCARRQQVDFSNVYYEAQQGVLVPSNSKVKAMSDLAGKRVCATAQSTPIQVMERLPSPPVPVGASQAIDCLVELQQGSVAAISTDSSILLGFTAQDPDTKLLGVSLGAVPYGMAINKAHPEFVRFVNGVLAHLEADGTWRRLYDKWLGRFGPPEPLPPARYDG